MVKAKVKAQQQPQWQNRIVNTGVKPASEYLANPSNWRIHPKSQRDALKGVLSEVGWVTGVVENVRTGHLIDGHARIEEALKLGGETPVPFIQVDLSEDEERLILATLDPISAMAAADKEQVDALLQQVQTSDAAVQQMLADVAKGAGLEYGKGEPKDAEPQIDRAEELRVKWGVNSGDLWRMGEHRILCADCLKIENVRRVMGCDTPVLVIADPPYGVNIVAANGYVRGSIGAANVVDVGKYAPIIGDETTDTAIEASSLMLAEYPKAVQVWWGANYYADKLKPSACWLVWDKDTTGNFADCELAWTNRDKAARLFHHRWNGMLRDSERQRRWHPTQKPAALAAWVFTELTTEGAIVLDPFAGAGWAVLGAEQTNRKCRAIEASADYVAVILERWSQATGKQPERIETQ